LSHVHNKRNSEISDHEITRVIAKAGVERVFAMLLDKATAPAAQAAE
jgi:hypothetical protein